MKTSTQKAWIWGGIVVVAIVVASMGIFAYGKYSKLDQPTPSVPGVVTTSTEPVACNSDGKVCPDGSVVGRTGPKCEFTACPAPEATSTVLMTYLGGKVTGLGVTVNPSKLVSDSRCPQGVQCIWAGTVEVKTTVETATGHGEHIFKLGESFTVGNFLITLTNVTPARKPGETIAESSYRFTFEVKKK